MSDSVKREDMRFTVIDNRTGDPYAGLADIPGNQANLMRAVPVEGHWYDLPVHGSVALEGGNLKVVRVK